MIGRTYDTSKALRPDGVGETVTDDRLTKWARAERAARGLTDGGVRGAVRRYYTTVIPAIFLISIAVELTWQFRKAIGFMEGTESAVIADEM